MANLKIVSIPFFIILLTPFIFLFFPLKFNPIFLKIPQNSQIQKFFLPLYSRVSFLLSSTWHVTIFLQNVFISYVNIISFLLPYYETWKQRRWQTTIYCYNGIYIFGIKNSPYIYTPQHLLVNPLSYTWLEVFLTYS